MSFSLNLLPCGWNNPRQHGPTRGKSIWNLFGCPIQAIKNSGANLFVEMVSCFQCGERMTIWRLDFQVESGLRCFLTSQPNKHTNVMSLHDAKRQLDENRSILTNQPSTAERTALFNISGALCNLVEEVERISRTVEEIKKERN